MKEKNEKNVDWILRDIRSGRVNDRTIVKATAGSVLGSRLRRPVNEVLQTLARAENLL